MKTEKGLGNGQHGMYEKDTRVEDDSKISHWGERRMVLPSTEGGNTRDSVGCCFLRGGKENVDDALSFIYFVWRIPRTEEPGGPVHGVTESDITERLTLIL